MRGAASCSDMKVVPSPPYFVGKIFKRQVLSPHLGCSRPAVGGRRTGMAAAKLIDHIQFTSWRGVVAPQPDNIVLG